MSLLDEARERLGHIKYKDGWEIRFDVGEQPHSYVLTVGHQDYDSCDRRPYKRPVHHSAATNTSHLEFVLSEPGSFERWVYEVVRELEIHEIHEWFRLDGAPLMPTHAYPTCPKCQRTTAAALYGRDEPVNCHFCGTLMQVKFEEPPGGVSPTA